MPLFIYLFLMHLQFWISFSSICILSFKINCTVHVQCPSFHYQILTPHPCGGCTEMEKQRSFSMKPARLVVFSLTISSFLISISFLFIWVNKANPPLNQETHFHIWFNPFSVQTTETQVNRDLSDSATTSTSRDTKSSSGGKISEIRDTWASDEAVASESRIRDTWASDEAVASESRAPAGDSGNITWFDSKLAAVAVNYFIPAATHPGGVVDLISKETQDLMAEAYNGSKRQDVSDTTSEKLKTLSKNDPLIEENSKRVCDVTRGKWVFDETYPLYTNNTCPFIDEGFNCEANGRMDKDYMKWRWQPQDCPIPRFNATEMLQLIRGKRVVFVGDSLNRNQWESMLCLLMGAIKDPKKVYETRGRRITKSKGDYRFKFVDYKCTVEYYATHYLVREGSARIGKKRSQTLRIDTIDKGSSRWRGADILVFNTAHWWSHHKTKAGINYYQEGNQIHPRLQVSEAFRRALVTWASWVDKYVNPNKTRVFFRTSAPSHFSGGQWNSGGHCKEASQPTNVTLGISPVKNGIVEEVARQMKTPVTFLSITGMSNYRIDGHPSIYGRKSENSGVQDCSHWCLPGVPDSWNELLYYHLHFNVRNGHTE